MFSMRVHVNIKLQIGQLLNPSNKVIRRFKMGGERMYLEVPPSKLIPNNIILINKI